MNKFKKKAPQEGKVAKPKKKRRGLKVVGIVFLVIVCVLGVGLLGAYIHFKPALDKAKQEAFTAEGNLNETTFRRAGNTVVLDDKGKQIAKVTGNDYSYTKLGDITDYVKNGYIATEDKDFLKHGGISYKSIAQAGIDIIKNHGKVTRGGSTITQQLVKLVLLNNVSPWERKITEWYLAPKIEKIYSKNQILEFYVNNCYYGNGAYGIETASKRYFSKPASKLTLTEASTLVGLSNNPSKFDPIRHPEASQARRKIVLDSMLQDGYINQVEYNKAVKEKLSLAVTNPSPVNENYMTSYAIDCTVRNLMKQDGFKFQYWFDTDKQRTAYEANYKEVYSEYNQKVRSGGYTIYTSIDRTKQDMLQLSVDNTLSGFTETNPQTKKYAMQGSAVSIDNSTGYVVAIVGGRGNNDIYNRGFLAYRQPGSSIKPLLDYTPAFEQGYTPMKKIDDSPIDNGPHNDEGQYYGPVTIRYATELSLNTVAYKVLSMIKPKTGLSYLEKMEYSGLHPEDNNPIAGIGGFTEGTTPVEQASGYYALENKGYYVEPTCVKKVVYAGVENLYTSQQEAKKVYSPETAYMMTDILKGVINTDYGTGHRLKIPGQIVAGKTGTTSDNKDGWFCGYSAYYTTAVWVGYDQPRSVDNLYGATYPGQIWQDYMTKVHKGLSSKDFEKPSGIVYKFIDGLGNPTDVNTGTKDMFSEPILEAQDEEERQQKIKEAALKQADWDKHEPDREKNAENLLKAYEGLSYTDESSLTIVDNAYNSANAAIQQVDSKTKATDYKTRLSAHHDAIQNMRSIVQAQVAKREEAERQAEANKQAAQEKANQDAINQAKIQAQAEADAQIVARQQEQLQRDNDAKNAVAYVESLPSDTSYDSMQQAINSASEKVALVVDQTKHDNYTSRLATVAQKFGIQ